LKDWTCIATILSGQPQNLRLKDITLTDILTVEAKGVGDDMTVVWVRSPTGGGEAGGGTYQVKKSGTFPLPKPECQTDKVRHTH